MKKKITI